MRKELMCLLAAATVLSSCGESSSSSAENSSQLPTAEESSSVSVTAAQTESPPQNLTDEEPVQQNDDTSSLTDEQEDDMSWKLFEDLYDKLDDNDRSKRNYLHNKEVDIDGFIEYGQAQEPVRDLILGDVSFAGVGCEVVAAYNYLLYTSNERDIARLTFDFEHNALFAHDGKLGSNARKIKGLFDALGIEYNRYLDPDDCRKAIDDGKPVLLSFHTGNSVFSAIHTVFIMTENGKHYVFNRYNESEGRYEFETLSDVVKKDGLFIVAYTTA
ncbi:MAG: hypothetical protein IJ571_05415 [Ruminococcus sp.]|nr:hypothetical protein [Ruminococcus sp.]